MTFPKVSFYRNLWIYLVCTVSAILILFGLNWILKLPRIVDVIGDENTWLPIVANAIISGIIFIAGNWYSNADRLRNIIAEEKQDFNQICDAVNRVVNSLNISRKQLTVLYSIEINMETPSLIKEILLIQQGIDEAQQEFKQVRYLIKEDSAVAEFENCIDTITKSYHVVFDAMQKILNDWISAVSSGTQAKTVADYIGKDGDKAKFAMTYVAHCKKLQNEKDKLLNVYESQKQNVAIMFLNVQSKGKHILDAEYKRIQQLENKL